MIEVNEYIRTKLGDIKQITEGFEFIIERHNKSDNYIVKHSKNIIGLIEVGDYVKSKDGIEGKVDFVMLPLKIFVNGEEILNDDIKSIVTKEQFKNIEYIVEE